MASIRMKSKGAKCKRLRDAYVIKVEAARFYRQRRYYWTVCRAAQPEELVSWGDASSQEEAAETARNEVSDLMAGLSDGGHLAPAGSPTLKYHNRP